MITVTDNRNEAAIRFLELPVYDTFLYQNELYIKTLLQLGYNAIRLDYTETYPIGTKPTDGIFSFIPQDATVAPVDLEIIIKNRV